MSDLISLSFTEQDWNYIFNALSTRPYGEVVNLITNLQKQFNEKIKVVNDPT